MTFMTRDLSKTVMKRSRLCNKSLKNNSEENRNRYTKRKHFFLSLLRTTKKAKYENLMKGKFLISNFFGKLKAFTVRKNKCPGKDDKFE